MKKEPIRARLLARRRQLLSSREKTKTTRRQLHTPEIETEEEARKVQEHRLFETLDSRQKNEIEAIDAALTKLETGDFGLCDGCGERISIERLDVLPHTRWCLECAEHGPIEKTAVLPFEDKAEAVSDDQTFQNKQIIERLEEEIKQDGRVDMQDLEAYFKEGILSLEGLLPDETQHEILISIVEDILDIKTYQNNIRIDRIPWERRSRTPGRDEKNHPEKEKMMEGEATNEETFESQKTGRPLSPPDKLVPET